MDQLAAALVAAQAEFSAVPKTADNPFFKSKYADLATVVSHTQPILAKHGLAVSQFPTQINGEPALITYLLHASGQVLSDTMKLCAAKNDPQGQGAAITYARRFAYMAVLGLVADADDDGNAATRAKMAEKPPSRKRLAQDALMAVCKRKGLVPGEVGQRFADDYGVSVAQADADAIEAFTKVIDEESA